MSHNILITGASGYLGGTILAHWKDAKLPAYNKLYALARSEEGGEKVKQYGAEPLVANLDDHDGLTRHIVEKQITIIYYLVDAYTAKHQPALIKALGTVKAQTGKEVHFLNTTGAKQFSSHAGVPTDKPLLDTNPKLYDIQKESKAPLDFVKESVNANPTVIETAEAHGVRSYIFAPCLVYGRGEGFGNKTSIQDVAIVQAAQKAGRVYAVDYDHPTWPVCHISDTADLYLQILRKILEGADIGHGKNGYFLAASGSVAWNDVYSAMARGLKKRGVIDNDSVTVADKAALAKMSEAFGLQPEAVPVLLGGKCMFTAEHGRKIGWVPKFPPEHILETADEDVESILEGFKAEEKASIR